MCVLSLLSWHALSAINAGKVCHAMNEANLNALSVQFSNIRYAESCNYFVKLKNENDKLKNENDKLKNEQDKLKNEQDKLKNILNLIHASRINDCSAKGSCSGLELFSTDRTRDDE